MTYEKNIRNSASIMFLSLGFLLMLLALLFEDDMFKLVSGVVGILLILAAALYQYALENRQRTLIEVCCMGIILLWGIVHLALW